MVEPYGGGQGRSSSEVEAAGGIAFFLGAVAAALVVGILIACAVQTIWPRLPG